jgi:hypothetical protein
MSTQVSQQSPAAHAKSGRDFVNREKAKRVELGFVFHCGPPAKPATHLQRCTVQLEKSPQLRFV